MSEVYWYMMALLLGVVLIVCGIFTGAAAHESNAPGGSIMSLGLLGAGGYLLYLVFTGGL